MSLFNTLSTALTGLRASQSRIDLISRNVANADTPGYTRKTVPLQTVVIAGEAAGVRTGIVSRQVDENLFAQVAKQLGVSNRYETINEFLGRLDSMFGQPDDDTSISATVKALTTALQELTDYPERAEIRQKVLDAAENVAIELNNLSDQVQAMRKQAEDAILASVNTINDALENIHRLNGLIAQRTVTNQTTADLEDERDLYLRRLSEQMGVKFIRGDANRIAVFTESGRTLVDGGVNRLEYEPASSISAYSSRSNGLVGAIILSSTGEDLLVRNEITQGVLAGLTTVRDELLPTAQAQLDELAHALALRLSSEEHKVGTGTSMEIDLSGFGDNALDALQINYKDGTGTFRSLTVNYDTGANAIWIDTNGDGTAEFTESVGGSITMAMQNLLDDAFNGGIGANERTWAFSSDTAASTLTIQSPPTMMLTGGTLTDDGVATAIAGSSGPTAWIDTDNIGMIGDTIIIDYTDASGTAQQLKIEIDASVDLDLDGVVEDDEVLAKLQSSLQAALNASPPNWTVGYDPGGRQLALRAPPGFTIGTVRSFTELGLGVPLFVDKSVIGETAYQDLKPPNYAAVPEVDQKVGFASRITVNSVLTADTTKLVQFKERRDGATDLSGANVLTADVGANDRALEMVKRMSVTTFTFAASTGIGGGGAPYTATIELFSSSLVSYQANQAAEYSRRQVTEDRYTELLTQKLDGQSGVNVDDELSQLMVVQNAYGASARVMSSVQSMLDELMGMVR